MRRWLKWTLIAIVSAMVLFGVLAGVSGYYFVRHLETATSAEADAQKKFDAVRARFGDRQPLVEITNPNTGDVRINKSAHPEGREASTLHAMTWTAEDGQWLQTDMPLWLLRFNALNILSKIGVTPSKYRLVVQDLVKYGPGVVADYRRPGDQYVLLWVE